VTISMNIEGIHIHEISRARIYHIIHEKNIVFISVISMNISMDIFISAYPWGPLEAVECLGSWFPLNAEDEVGGLEDDSEDFSIDSDSEDD
jgi:hypothetical protein